MTKQRIFNMLIGNTTPIFYDCEFEVKRHGCEIIPISIAMCELNDYGKKIYLINSQYDWSQTENEWLLSNVKPAIDSIVTSGNVNHLPDSYKSNLYIDVCDFNKWSKYINHYLKHVKNNIQLWGYYSSFDHVVFSSIFGNMIDFPSNINMWTNDIQQILQMFNINKNQLLSDCKYEHDCLADACWNRDLFNNLLKHFEDENEI